MNTPERPPPNIHLHIERLVLDGLDLRRLDAWAVRQELEAELTHLLQTGGLSTEMLAGQAIPSLSMGAILPSQKPQALGTRVAQALYGGIGHGAGNAQGSNRKD